MILSPLFPRPFSLRLLGSLSCACLFAFRAPAAEAWTLPVVDLSADTSRQVIVARGSEKVYQGHPTTVLLPDNKTLLAVWTYGHGGVCGPYKRSTDGGLTWSELLPVPESWTKVRNCPALYRLTDPAGIARLVVYAGEGPDGSIYESHSLDEGRTWTPMKSIGQAGVMPFCTIEPIRGGKALLAMTNIRRPGETKEKRSNVLVQSESTDGGLTWSPFKLILDLPGLKPCEPWLVRSPKGDELLCLIRENVKRVAFKMTSRDEGATWSPVAPLPPGLCGDRHVARYLPDGRLVVCMRDTAPGSPTRNHFVAWIGTYDDIVAGRPGQYRVKLLHSHKGADCGYPGVEVLPGGIVVATTYVKYRPGAEQNSVVSVRFDPKETDRLALASSK